MDEKHSTQASRGVSSPTNVQSQPARLDAGAASSKTSGNASSASENATAIDGAASPIPLVEPTKQSGGLMAVLQASRTELEQLLANTQRIHERSWRLIHTLLEDSQLRASQAVDACLARFEKEIQDRVSSETAAMLENFDVEAGARLNARLDQAIAAAKQRQHSIEQDLAVAVAENRKQLDQISTGAMDGLRQSQQNLLGDMQREGQRQVGELSKNAMEMSEKIQHLADTLGAELKQSTDEAVRIFHSRIEQVWEEIVGRAEKQIAEMANTCVTELAKQARQVVDQEMSEFLNHVLRRFDRSSDAPSSNQRS
jgi:hypothetical protein